MDVFLAFLDKQGTGLEWVKDPELKFADIELQFTAASAKVVICGDKLKGKVSPLDYTELAQIELSRLGVSFTTMLPDIKTGVCIHGRYVDVPFIVSGPLPHRLLLLCSGERVAGPTGFYTTYGG